MNKVLDTVFTLFLLTIGIVVVLSLLGKIDLLVVKSGSMEPAIPVNSLLVVKPIEESDSEPGKIQIPRYYAGEVITFQPNGANLPITHRVLDREIINNKTFYQTKGDANKTPDSHLVAQDDVLGNVDFVLPWVGYTVDFSTSILGFFLIIVLPASFVILKELLAIQKELKKSQLKNATVSGLLVLISVLVVPTIALFNDEAVIESNLLSTKESFSETEIPPECSHISFDGNPIIGTPAGEKLVGTTGNDLIFGLGGGDKLEGGSGDDCLVGGSGGDKLIGGNGKDVLLGGGESDGLEGGNGEDILIGGDGSDGLKGGNGQDQIFGGEGSDGLEGNNDDDYLDGGAGSDGLDGGLGTDTCVDGESLNSCEIF